MYRDELQVKAHEDVWDLSRCSPPAKAAWLLSRALWSAKEAGRDVSKDSRDAISKFASTDEDEQQVDNGPVDEWPFEPCMATEMATLSLMLCCACAEKYICGSNRSHALLPAR
jgi:hypothetical protein